MKPCGWLLQTRQRLCAVRVGQGAMGNLLYLVHRLPYPPNKGDKVRSFHLLQHLLKSHRVFLGTFVDDPEDLQHLPRLKELCPDLHVERIQPRLSKLRSLSGLMRRSPLTLGYYRHAGMARWVQETLAKHRMQASVVVSSAMVQYAQPASPAVPMLIDFVDVDSHKWAQYAGKHPWPLSWLYRREASLLAAHERKAAGMAKHSFFVSNNETAVFLNAAPECAGRVTTLGNGVNADYFSPDPHLPSPYSREEQAIVFVGTMDYWPNIDAVTWFVSHMLEPLRKACPQVRFHIVGRNPTVAVSALAGQAVSVTGTVADVRPFIQHAKVLVAPLRVSPGLPNKILEAMAMAKPVVTVPACSRVIGAGEGQGLLVASTGPEFVKQIQRLLADPQEAHRLGQAARQHVVQHFRWGAHLAGLDQHLAATFAQETP